MTAGAYGAVQSSIYNSRLLIPEVLVKGAEWSIIRPRPSYADMLNAERMPDWLQENYRSMNVLRGFYALVIKP